MNLLATFLRLENLPLCNDPRNDPKCKGDEGPATSSEKRTLAHVFGTSEDTNIDILGCDVTINDTSDYDLGSISNSSSG